jgi:hypothetical protein
LALLRSSSSQWRWLAGPLAALNINHTIPGGCCHMSVPNKERLLLIGEAIAKGFSVIPTEDNTAWLVAVPAKPRMPAHEQGEFKTPDRAWSVACLIARDYG